MPGSARLTVKVSSGTNTLCLRGSSGAFLASAAGSSTYQAPAPAPDASASSASTRLRRRFGRFAGLAWGDAASGAGIFFEAAGAAGLRWAAEVAISIRVLSEVDY